MDKFKKILHRILFPSARIGIPLGILFIIFVGIVFAAGLEGTAISYPAYLLSAYGLFLLVIYVLAPIGRAVICVLRRIPFIDRCFADAAYRMRLFLCFGTAVNALYALFKLITGVRFHSAWFISIAVYYFALCAIRFAVIGNDVLHVRRQRQSEIRQWKSCRIVGALLLMLGLALSGVTVQVVRDDRSYTYPETIIFAVALYAFYRIIAAAVRLLRRSSEESATAFAVKLIDITVAVVAMFTLQVAMLSAFGEGTVPAKAMNIATGTAAMAFVLGAAGYMMTAATRKVRELAEQE